MGSATTGVRARLVIAVTVAAAFAAPALAAKLDEPPPTTTTPAPETVPATTTPKPDKAPVTTTTQKKNVTSTKTTTTRTVPPHAVTPAPVTPAPVVHSVPKATVHGTKAKTPKHKVKAKAKLVPVVVPPVRHRLEPPAAGAITGRWTSTLAATQTSVSGTRADLRILVLAVASLGAALLAVSLVPATALRRPGPAMALADHRAELAVAAVSLLVGVMLVLMLSRLTL